MVESPAVRVPRSEAEATRRRLLELDALRIDLAVAKVGGDVIFPVVESCEGPRLPTIHWEFEARELRPAGYQDLLDLPPEEKALAPRAFDQVGDIVVVKVPQELWLRRVALGEALLRFHKARAVFHDRGVKDPYRVRELERIAGEGDALTAVHENGVRLWVDPSKAYYSPRLASERDRVAKMVRPGEHVVDLFGGVAPFGIQAALRGALVDSIDLNPDAVALARRNVEGNALAEKVRLYEGDARVVAPTLAPADRIFMNLPHGAGAFLGVAAALAKPRATIHYHEILRNDRVPARMSELVASMRGRQAKVANTRVVRNYSPEESHVAFDIALD
ncbi:MAG: class I SAM-dependent methyltransferase family protein [Thermoplasmatota archaeon]